MNDIESILLTTMSNDISICKLEKFDINMAMWLVSEPNILSRTDKTRISKMLKTKTKGNCFDAYYKLGKQAEGTIGRFCVKNGIGLQGLSRDPRSALAYPFYWDLDFQNCQCQIALQECKKQGWICVNLEYYCNNREQLFKDFLAENELYTRDFIKEEFLRLMFGGKPNYNTPKWIKEEFYPELNNFMKNICNAYPKLYSRVKRTRTEEQNRLGSTCALFLQSQERRCLMAFDNFLNQNKRYMGMFLHDGGYVEKLPGELEFPKELIKGAEDFIFETTGLKLKIVNKPIETSFSPTERRILNPDNTYPMIKSEFELRNFKCIDNGCYYEILDDDIKIRTRTDLKNSFEHLVYEQEDKNGFVEDCSFIDRWVKDKSIRVYDKVELYPPPLKCPDNHFNLWTGYRIDKVSLENITAEQDQFLNESLDFILNHLKKLSGEDLFDWFIKFNALLIQQPGIKPLVSIILLSLPGLGKERWYVLIEKILGSKYCVITQRADDIFGTFNGIIEGKILVVLDECNMAISSKYQEEMKSLITRSEDPINNKGIKNYRVKSYTHLLNFTNNDLPFKIEENDRRYVAIDRTKEIVPDFEYFDKLVELLDNDLVVRKVFDYFMSIDLSTFNVKDRPNTDFMKELKENSRPIETQFIIAFIQKMNEDIMITSQDLFQEFKAFIQENFMDLKYSSTVNKLSIRINKLGIDRLEKKHGMNGTYWVFNYKSALEWCYNKEYLEKPPRRLLK